MVWTSPNGWIILNGGPSSTAKKKVVLVPASRWTFFMRPTLDFPERGSSRPLPRPGSGLPIPRLRFYIATREGHRASLPLQGAFLCDFRVPFTDLSHSDLFSSRPDELTAPLAGCDAISRQPGPGLPPSPAPPPGSVGRCDAYLSLRLSPICCSWHPFFPFPFNLLVQSTARRHLLT